MKEKLEQMLEAKNTRKAEIVEAVEKSDSVEEIKGFSAELDSLNDEIRDLEKMIADLPSEEEARTQAVNAEVPEIVKEEKKMEENKVFAEVKTDDSKVYRSFGEQLEDIRKFAMGYGLTPALEKVQRAASGMNEGTGADGGFLVQSDFAGNILQSVAEKSELLNLVDKYQVSAKSNEVYYTVLNETSIASSVYGGVAANWVDEGDAITASKPSLKQLRVALNKLACLAYVTEEQMQDAAFTGSVLEDSFALAIARESEKKIIDLVVANAGTVTIAKETSQTADTVNAKNILKMRAALLAGNRRNAVWVMHPDVAAVLPELYLTGTNSDNFIYMPENGISVRGYDTLFGRPVIESDFCSELGEKGDILLLDPKEILWAYKGGIDMASSIHIKFNTAEQAFRAIYRANGACKRSATVSIKNSSVARSAYVALAQRA